MSTILAKPLFLELESEFGLQQRAFNLAWQQGNMMWVMHNSKTLDLKKITKFERASYDTVRDALDDLATRIEQDTDMRLTPKGMNELQAARNKLDGADDGESAEPKATSLPGSSGVSASSSATKPLKKLTLKATPARKDDSNSKDAAGAKDKEPQTPHTTVKPSPLSSPEPTPPRPKLDLDISMEDLEIKELDEYMRYTFKVTCDFFKPDASQGALYDTVLYVRDAAVKAAMVRSGVKVEHSKLHEAMDDVKEGVFGFAKRVVDKKK